jgi:pimeloyl-ACP methyl ester carboxylesterase
MGTRTSTGAAGIAMQGMTSLVLVPGLLCNELLWAHQLDALQAHAIVTISDLTAQATITDMAAAILRNAPPRFCLAGFSMGSWVALEIMELAPDRVEKLALLSATHGGLLPATAVAIEHSIGTIEQQGLDAYLDAAYPTYVAPSRASDAPLKACFVSMARAVGAKAGLQQMRALLAVTSPYPNLGKIRCPTILIGGQEDHRTTPEAHEKLAAEIPGAVLTLIQNSGHFTPLEAPDEVRRLLERWLAP